MVVCVRVVCMYAGTGRGHTHRSASGTVDLVTHTRTPPRRSKRASERARERGREGKRERGKERERERGKEGDRERERERIGRGHAHRSESAPVDLPPMWSVSPRHATPHQVRHTTRATTSTHVVGVDPPGVRLMPCGDLEGYSRAHNLW